MKARVKSTGEIVDETAMVSALGSDFYLGELEPISEDTDVVDYWTRLEHQYVGMTLAGICANPSYDEASYATMAEDAIRAAHALVEKMKQEREG